ncbi:MAG: transcriptional regulator [Actinomycetota bacterium]
MLAALADDAEIRLRDVADQVRITERAAQSIVADLANAGFVTRTRVGRRNRYEVHGDAIIDEGDRRFSVTDLLETLSRPHTRQFVDVGFHHNGARQN